MPKPRINFPVWELAQEIAEAEDLSMREAVQKVAECAAMDAVDVALAHTEGRLWETRTPKIRLKQLRKEYHKHHPRAGQDVEVSDLPAPCDESPTPGQEGSVKPVPEPPVQKLREEISASAIIDEQIRLIEQYQTRVRSASPSKSETRSGWTRH